MWINHQGSWVCYTSTGLLPPALNLQQFCSWSCLWGSFGRPLERFPGERAAAVPAGDPAGFGYSCRGSRVGASWSLHGESLQSAEDEGEDLLFFSDGVMSPGRGLSVQAKEPETANSVHCPLSSCWHRVEGQLDDGVGDRAVQGHTVTG